MAYQSATEELRKALEGYSEREDRLTRLYSEATKRLDESRRKGLESLERDHGEARRTLSSLAPVVFAMRRNCTKKRAERIIATRSARLFS